MNKEQAPIEMIHNYEEAFEIGKSYIDALDNSIKKSYKPDMVTELPLETASKRWSMTLTALENTLTYIFKKLHHPCYMLCVLDATIKIYKLVMKDASPTFIKAMEDRHIPNLDKNDQITEKQRSFIKDKLKNIDNVRIMQCIVKEQKLESSNYDMINQYRNLLSEIKLPNGVFILNLTDAVILKNDGKEPFTMVTGDAKLGEYNFREYIPILGMSGQKGYRDVPIPNYDDVELVMTQQKQKEMNNFTTSWKDKTIIKAVFRGGPSGCGYTAETNMRIKLANMKYEYLDAGITTENSYSINSKSIKFDPKYGLGMMNMDLKPVKRLSMTEQSKYKYIIHIDGNVNAYRLLTTMCTGSLIIRVSSEYRSWVDHLIKPGDHYVPVKSDLSNLQSCIRWCLRNDQQCRQIATTGRNFAISVLQKEYMKNHFQNIFWFFSKYQSSNQLKQAADQERSPPYPPPALQKNMEIIHKKWKLPSPSISPPTPPPPIKQDGRREPGSPKYPPPNGKQMSPGSPKYPPPRGTTPDKDILSSPDSTPPQVRETKKKRGGYVIPTDNKPSNNDPSTNKTKKSRYHINSVHFKI